MSSYGRSIAAINKELDRLGAVQGYANSLSGIVKRLSSIEIGGGGEGSGEEWELLWENEQPDRAQAGFDVFSAERMEEIKQEYSELKVRYQIFTSDTSDYNYNVHEMFMSTNIPSNGVGGFCRLITTVGSGSFAVGSRSITIQNGALHIANCGKVIYALTNVTNGTINSTYETDNGICLVVAIYGKKVSE